MAEAIKGLNIKLGLDTTELEASIKSLNSDLKEQQRDLAAINKNLKYDSSNVDLWKQKQEKLNEILNTTKKKLEEQKKALELAKEGVKLGTVSEQEFKKMQRAVQYTEAEVAKLNNELKETDKKVSALGSVNVDKLSAIGSAMTKYITVPVTAAVSALSALALKTVETVNQMSDTAKQLGVGLEAMQKWEYAAKQLGSETQYLDKAFQKVNNLLGQIANGDDVSEELAKIGLTMDDLAGLDAEQAFAKIRSSIANVGDAATRTALANQFFGDKLGTQLAPVLSATEEELEAWMDEAEKVGIVSEEDAEITGALGNEIYALKQAFLSLRTELATALAPVITKIVEFLREKVIPKIKEIIQKFAELSTKMKAFIGIITGLLAAIGPVLTIVAKAIQTFSKLKEVLGTVSEAFKAVKSGAAGGPWGILIAILAVLLLQNENFRALLKRILEIVQQLISKIMELVQRIIEKLKPILDILMDVINQVIDVLVEVIDGILDVVMMVLDEVVKLLESLIEPITRILEMLTAILVPITQLIAKILQVVAKILQLVIGLIVQIIEVVIELIDGVLNIVIEIINVIVDILGAVIKVIVTLLDIIIDILEPILEIILAILEPLIEFISGIIEVIAELFEILLPLIEVFLTPIMDILDVIFTIIEAITPILVIIGNVIKAVIVPVLQLLFQILKPILDILNAIISAVKWILDHTVGWLVKLIGKMFGTGDFDAENTVKNTSNQYMNTDNSKTTNNVTINTTGDVDMDSINEALGGAY